MIADRTTPVDEHGIPLLIIPDITALPANWPNSGTSPHHLMHPASSPELKEPDPRFPESTDGGWAARNITRSVQDELHNQGPHSYHRYFKGSPLPADRSKQFAMLVLLRAGLVQERGIDMTGDEPIERAMTEEEYGLLRMPRLSQPDGYAGFSIHAHPARRFTANYILGQSPGNLSQVEVDEYLNERTASWRRLELGHVILSRLIEAAAEVIEPTYNKAVSDGILDPRLHMSVQALIKTRLLGDIGYQESRLMKRLTLQLLEELAAA